MEKTKVILEYFLHEKDNIRFLSKIETYAKVETQKYLPLTKPSSYRLF